MSYNSSDVKLNIIIIIINIINIMISNHVILSNAINAIPILIMIQRTNLACNEMWFNIIIRMCILSYDYDYLIIVVITSACILPYLYHQSNHMVTVIKSNIISFNIRNNAWIFSYSLCPAYLH